MRHFYRTLAVAVSIGFAAFAAAQSTSTAPTTRTAPSTITNAQPRPAITNPLATTTRTAPRTSTTTTRVTPVPEPSQWAMMLAGLALVGFIVRRSSKRS